MTGLTNWAKMGAVRELSTATTTSPTDYLREQYTRARRSVRPSGSGAFARAGQRVDLVGIVLTLVIVGVIAYVGINVMSTTEESAGLDTSADAANRTEFENASADLTSGIASAFSLMEVVFIVLLLSGIIALLVGLRGRQ